MTTHFAWRHRGEKFNSQAHGRCDLEILDLAIDHREGEVALATVLVSQFKLPDFSQRHAFISYKGQLLFSGRLVGFPVKVSDGLAKLEFTAEPLDAGGQLESLASDLKHAPFWDDAFMEVAEQGDPAEWLEARSALFAWDRLTGTVCVSDLFQGRNILDLTDVFFEDSLTIRLADTPLSQISVTLSAQWVQEGAGEISLGRKIAAAFSGGMINTLTPHALQATWPKEGQKLGRSGFWVVKSHLREVTPPHTGVLGIYPTLTPEIAVWDEVAQGPKKIRAKQFWMVGTLILGWRYRQKRRERVQFTLRQKTQLDGAIRPLSRTLSFSLQKAPQGTGTSFFLTHRGVKPLSMPLKWPKRTWRPAPAAWKLKLPFLLKLGYACLWITPSVLCCLICLLLWAMGIFAGKS